MTLPVYPTLDKPEATGAHHGVSGCHSRPYGTVRSGVILSASVGTTEGLSTSSDRREGEESRVAHSDSARRA
jgi:hypothetical protein